MALDGPAERRDEAQQVATGNGNGVAPPPPRAGGRPSGAAAYADRRLRLNPNTEHRPQDYSDVRGEYPPAVYSALERHLPPSLLEADRDVKLHFMRDILARYWPHGERNKVQRHKEYRQRILHLYKPLHQELYNMRPSAFFLPTFLEAIRINTEESFRSIMTEPTPGVYSFAMLQPSFCEMLLEEVENFEKWVHTMKFKIMRPNTMNKYGAVLDDFGLEAMLNQFMEQFIAPISKVFYPEVGGGTLDSHHAFVVEYGKDRDVELAAAPARVAISILVGSHAPHSLPPASQRAVVPRALMPPPKRTCTCAASSSAATAALGLAPTESGRLCSRSASACPDRPSLAWHRTDSPAAMLDSA